MMRNLHIALFNLSYLHLTWHLHQVDDDEEEEVLPPTVAKIFKSDPVLSQMFENENEGSDNEKLITSKRELLRTINTLERALPFYRGYLERFPRVRTNTYLSNLADITHEGKDLYKPDTEKCDPKESCFGMPIGTKYLTVLIEPRYYVILTRVVGKMKIAYVMPYVD